MKQVWNKLTCLNCKQEIIQVADVILNVSIDKSLKKKILDDEWMSTRCPNCHCVVKSIYPCIYKDVDKKLYIHVKRKFEIEEENYVHRYVNSREEFIEMVRIWDDHECDEGVLFVKGKLLEKYEHVVYRGCDDEVYFFECDGGLKLVLR